MPSKYWLKLYHETLDDPKMGRLSDRLYRRTMELFLLAGDTDKDGYLPPLADIAWRLRIPEDALLKDLRGLAEVGIVAEYESGWLVVNFAKRQAPVPGAERTARFRERQREDQYYDDDPKPEEETEPNEEPKRNVTPDVTEEVTNAVTTRYTDLDLDLEEEKDLDLEETQSGVHPPPLKESTGPPVLQFIEPITREEVDNPDPEFAETWRTAILPELLLKTTHSNGDTYLKPLKPICRRDGCVFIGAEGQDVIDWCLLWLKRLQRTVSGVLDEEVQVKLVHTGTY